MNRKALNTLEYTKITAMLQDLTGCEGSAQMAKKLSPYDDMHIIKRELRSTTEAVGLIDRKGPLPTEGLYDVDGCVDRAHKGGSLTMKELLEVNADLRIASRIVSFMKSDDIPDIPLIREMAELIMPVRSLENDIDRCIITEDEMADSASPRLRDIRRGIGRQNEAIKNRLNQIISSSDNRAYLQDAIVTMRDGRYVIPVKQEHRTRFPGMVHDTSKGGATLFVEPQAVVDLNNRLRELEFEEQQEMARILAELSSRVAEHQKEIKYNSGLIMRLDFIMAKGKLSRRMGACEPGLAERGVLKLIQARHPLIDEDKIVPIDITLGDGYRTLIVTGPNTGGKTVSLKTAGLLTMMAMSGLHIPASDESLVPAVKDVFADIGDEQSIEQSLSTFSSHMKNIVDIIENAGKGSLVLLDELGAGTDPTEGAALAISILERLYAAGAVTMATTHYNELKKYALSTDGAENAAMEFDVETLSPTYRLLIGVPGRSNAFEISKKLGLDASIIDRASQLIERGDLEFENVISSIEEDRKCAADDRAEAAMMVQEARRRIAKLEEREADVYEKRDRILSQAREEAREYIREAKEVSRDVQREMSRLAKNGVIQNGSGKSLQESKRRIREVEEKYASKAVQQINSDPVSADDLKVGDRVKVLTLNQNGSVFTLPDAKGELQVAIGAIKVNVNIKDLMVINEGGERKKTMSGRSRYGTLFKSKATSVSASIDVRGKNADDALMDVGKYLDDVYIAGLDTVTIIHGRGEGILKAEIRRALRQNKYVASFAAGKYNEGGEGVTIVTMKKN